MKVLFLTQICTPEPAFKSVPLASALRARGHDVRILTGYPNYPGGRLYAGYRMRLFQKETIDGVPILRVPLYPSHDASAARRIVSYGSLALTALVPLWFGWRPEVTYALGLPTLGLSAWTAKLFRGVPYVLDLQDLWPDAVVDSGMGKQWMKVPLMALCRFAYTRAAAMTVLSPGFKRVLGERGIQLDRINVVYNWCDETAIAPCMENTSPAPELKGRFSILYAGAMGKAQGLDTVVEAGSILVRQAPGVRFVLMGSGTETDRLKRMAARIAPDHVVFLDRRSPGVAAAIIRQADAALVHLRVADRYKITIPSKIQAYLAMGKPILGGVVGDAADLIDQAQAGMHCAPGDPQALATAAARMAALPRHTLEQMGRNGSLYYQERLAMRHGVARTEAILASVIRRHKGPVFDETAHH